MHSLSEHAKQELFNALKGRKTGVFVINGKLVSIEVENNDPASISGLEKDSSQKIDEYPELKASLSRYLNNPDMPRYSGSELKSKRNNF